MATVIFLAGDEQAAKMGLGLRKVLHPQGGEVATLRFVADRDAVTCSTQTDAPPEEERIDDGSVDKFLQGFRLQDALFAAVLCHGGDADIKRFGRNIELLFKNSPMLANIRPRIVLYWAGPLASVPFSELKELQQGLTEKVHWPLLRTVVVVTDRDSQGGPREWPKDVCAELLLWLRTTAVADTLVPIPDPQWLGMFRPQPNDAYDKAASSWASVGASESELFNRKALKTLWTDKVFQSAMGETGESAPQPRTDGMTSLAQEVEAGFADKQVGRLSPVTAPEAKTDPPTLRARMEQWLKAWCDLALNRLLEAIREYRKDLRGKLGSPSISDVLRGDIRRLSDEFLKKVRGAEQRRFSCPLNVALGPRLTEHIGELKGICEQLVEAQGAPGEEWLSLFSPTRAECQAKMSAAFSKTQNRLLALSLKPLLCWMALGLLVPLLAAGVALAWALVMHRGIRPDDGMTIGGCGLLAVMAPLLAFVIWAYRRKRCMAQIKDEVQRVYNEIYNLHKVRALDRLVKAYRTRLRRLGQRRLAHRMQQWEMLARQAARWDVNANFQDPAGLTGLLAPHLQHMVETLKRRWAQAAAGLGNAVSVSEWWVKSMAVPFEKDVDVLISDTNRWMTPAWVLTRMDMTKWPHVLAPTLASKPTGHMVLLPCDVPPEPGYTAHRWPHVDRGCKLTYHLGPPTQFINASGRGRHGQQS